jgi:hypothetical protein
MGYSLIELLGAIIHWIIKGCRTQLLDEINGNFRPTWGRSYDIENLIIGILTSIIFLGIIFLLLIITKTI